MVLSDCGLCNVRHVQCASQALLSSRIAVICQATSYCAFPMVTAEAGQRQLLYICTGQSPAGSTIMLIAPIPPSESSFIHLMAVTADGRRVYLSSQPINAPPAPVTKRPVALYNVTSRSAITPPAHQGQSRYTQNCIFCGFWHGCAMLHTPDIPLDLGMCIAERLALSVLYRDTTVHVLPELQGPLYICVGPACRSLNVTVAHYSQGALLLADTISEGNSRVLLVGRDLTIPPVGTSTGSGPGLREFVCEISPPTAGTAYLQVFVVLLFVCCQWLHTSCVQAALTGFLHLLQVHRYGCVLHVGCVQKALPGCFVCVCLHMYNSAGNTERTNGKTSMRCASGPCVSTNKGFWTQYCKGETGARLWLGMLVSAQSC